MTHRDWKKTRPTTLPQAMELCLAYAREVHHLSVDNVADLMSLPSKWRIYKWVEGADLPLRYLRNFEHACGCDFVTRYMAHSAHRLLIEIPRGRRVESADLHTLQQLTNSAVGALIEFAAGHAEATEVIAATTRAMEGLAWHRLNAEKHQQPELELDA